MRFLFSVLGLVLELMLGFRYTFWVSAAVRVKVRFQVSTVCGG